MQSDGIVDRFQAELDRRRVDLQAVLDDPAKADQHLDGLRALNELNQLEAKLADIRILDRTPAFQAVSEALEEAAARMTGNLFESALDELRQVVGNLGQADDS